jgi:Helix-turn-helix
MRIPPAFQPCSAAILSCRLDLYHAGWIELNRNRHPGSPAGISGIGHPEFAAVAAGADTPILGSNPLPEAHGWGAGPVRQRTTLGLSQKESAERLGVDPSTLAKWERAEREPTGVFLARVNRFLQGGKTSDARRVG